MVHNSLATSHYMTAVWAGTVANLTPLDAGLVESVAAPSKMDVLTNGIFACWEMLQADAALLVLVRLVSKPIRPPFPAFIKVRIAWAGRDVLRPLFGVRTAPVLPRCLARQVKGPGEGASRNVRTHARLPVATISVACS